MILDSDDFNYESVIVAKDEKGNSKGYGFIVFKQAHEAENFINECAEGNILAKGGFRVQAAFYKNRVQREEEEKAIAEKAKADASDPIKLLIKQFQQMGKSPNQAEQIARSIMPAFSPMPFMNRGMPIM